MTGTGIPCPPCLAFEPTCAPSLPAQVSVRRQQPFRLRLSGAAFSGSGGASMGHRANPRARAVSRFSPPEDVDAVRGFHALELPGAPTTLFFTKLVRLAGSGLSTARRALSTAGASSSSLAHAAAPGLRTGPLDATAGAGWQGSAPQAGLGANYR